MISTLQKMLDRITMYRLMLLFLLILWVATIFLSAAGLLSYNPVHILVTGVLLGLVCYAINWLLAKAFNAVTNLESAGITALILTLIVGPLDIPSQLGYLLLLGTLAMATKYILVRHQRHLFNPAAITVLITGITLGQGATWWIGGQYTFPLVVLGGILIITKIKRAQQVLVFLAIYFGYLLVVRQVGVTSLHFSPIWFFAAIMLTEPSTSPTFRKGQIVFGALIALIIISLQELFPRYPYAIETSLLMGNILTHLWSPTSNTWLKVQEKTQIAPNVWSLTFKPQTPLRFQPGQYLEITLPHPQSDSRGTRRYFTIASSPDQAEITLATRTTSPSSTFKQALLGLKKDQSLMASGPYGDFTLPHNPDQPLAFIAGGIGITPFLSIVEHLTDHRLPTNVSMLYFNQNQNEIPGKERLDQIKSDRIAVHYTTAQDSDQAYKNLITNKIPDYKMRVFYISGPPAMVGHYVKLLKQMKVAGIKTDYFPGY